MKSTPIWVCVLLMPCCLSCNRNTDALRNEMEKQATGIVQKVKEQAQALPNTQQIKEQIDGVISAVDQKDLQKLKDACDVVDVQLGTRVLVKYYTAFSLEIKDGPPSVISYLQNEISALADGDAEKKALTGLLKYFEAKGTLTTRDAAVLMLLVALETKFPHGRGTIFLAPFLDLPKSEEGPNEPPSDRSEKPSEDGKAAK